MKEIRKLKALDACSDAIEYLETQPDYQTAWQKLPARGLDVLDFKKKARFARRVTIALIYACKSTVRQACLAPNER